METHNPNATLSDEENAPIKFVASHSLSECYYLLRATGYQEAGFDNGIDAALEKIDNNTCKFCIGLIQYNRNKRGQITYRYPTVEAQGYLLAIDGGSTRVVGKIYFKLSVPVLMLIFAILFISTLVIALSPTADSILCMVIIFAVLISIRVTGFYLDRRTLIKLIRTTLDGDV